MNPQHLLPRANYTLSERRRPSFNKFSFWVSSNLSAPSAAPHPPTRKGWTCLTSGPRLLGACLSLLDAWGCLLLSRAFLPGQPSLSTPRRFHPCLGSQPTTDSNCHLHPPSTGPLHSLILRFSRRERGTDHLLKAQGWNVTPSSRRFQEELVLVPCFHPPPPALLHMITDIADIAVPRMAQFFS